MISYLQARTLNSSSSNNTLHSSILVPSTTSSISHTHPYPKPPTCTHNLPPKHPRYQKTSYIPKQTSSRQVRKDIHILNSLIFRFHPSISIISSRLCNQVPQEFEQQTQNRTGFQSKLTSYVTSKKKENFILNKFVSPARTPCANVMRR